MGNKKASPIHPNGGGGGNRKKNPSTLEIYCGRLGECEGGGPTSRVGKNDGRMECQLGEDMEGEALSIMGRGSRATCREWVD